MHRFCAIIGLVFLFFVGTKTFGQSFGTNLEGLTFTKLADSLNTENQILLAVEYYQKAQKEYLKSGDLENYLRNLLGEIGIYLELFESKKVEQLASQVIHNYEPIFGRTALIGDFYLVKGKSFYYQSIYDSATIYVQSAYDIFIENKDMPRAAFSQVSLGDIDWYRNDLPRPHYEHAKEIYEAHLEPDDPELGHAYFRLGTFELYDGHNRLAEDYLDRAIDLYRSGGNEIYMASAINGRALIDLRYKDFQTGLERCEIVMQVFEKRYGADSYRVSTTANVIGNLYSSLGDFTTAKEYFEKAYQIRKHIFGPSSTDATSMLMNVGNMELDLGYHGKSREIYFKTIKLMESNPNKGYDYYKVFHNIGFSYLEQFDTTNAIKYFKTALEKCEEVLDPGSTDWIGVTLDLASILKEPEAGLALCQRALNILFEEPINSLDISNVDLERVPSLIFLFETIAAQTRIAYQQYMNSAEDADLDRAAAYAHKGVEIADYFRQQIGTVAVELEFYPIIETHLHICLGIAYEQSKYIENTNAHSEWIYQLMEKCKSWLILRALGDRQTNALQGIPDSILQEERALKLNIDQLYQVQKSLSPSQKDSMSLLRAKLYVEKEALRIFQKSIKANYTDFEIFVDPILPLNLTQISAFVATQKSLLLHYVLTEEHVFILGINGDGSTFYKIEKPASFEEDVLSFFDWLKTKNPDKDLYESLVESIGEVLLDAPVELIRKAERITIIPDGLLHYVPFEVLKLEDAPEYLISSHSLSYSYSVALLLEEAAGNEEINTSFIAFAPDFSGEGKYMNSSEEVNAEIIRGDLTPLAGAIEEVNGISNFFNGTKHLAEEATETQFKQVAERKGILHFATHAIIDPNEVLNSYLVFANELDAENDGNLYSWEIQNMDLQAQLAVLSACNTGYGKLQNGEGMMSLGRSFVLAGCESVLMSYWPAQDQSTAQIMKGFYRDLATGNRKDDALREAKLSYLESADNNSSHPFYWAGFVLQGDVEALVGSSSKKHWPWVLFAALFLAVIFFRIKKPQHDLS